MPFLLWLGRPTAVSLLVLSSAAGWLRSLLLARWLVVLSSAGWLAALSSAGWLAALGCEPQRRPSA